MLNCKHIKEDKCNNSNCLFYGYSTEFCGICECKESIMCDFFDKDSAYCGRNLPDSYCLCNIALDKCEYYKLSVEHYRKGIKFGNK